MWWSICEKVVQFCPAMVVSLLSIPQSLCCLVHVLLVFKGLLATLWLTQSVSKAECLETCQSKVGVAPDPPISGRRFAVAPVSAVSAALRADSAHG